ncbi:MAG: TadE/TadG family type IV pilus assembly protein [Desulfitobacteriaceae bacterium]
MILKLKGKENGQALVEMALVLPIIILLLFGSIEIGRISYVYITINNAARVGARVASVGGNDLAITTAIEDSMILDNSALVITITPPESERQSGQGVTVEVSYPVNLFFAPVLEGIITNPFIVNANLTMRLE